MPNVYYDKILGKLRDAGLSDSSAAEIALVLSDLLVSSEENELSNKESRVILNNILEQLIINNNLLKLILS